MKEEMDKFEKETENSTMKVHIQCIIVWNLKLFFNALNEVNHLMTIYIYFTKIKNALYEKKT